MDRTERLYRIEQLLRSREWVPLASFLDELECSRATFKRDLEYLRDRLNAPILWDRERRGYRLQDRGGYGPRYELPGFWLSAHELYALLGAQQLLSEIEPGILSARLAPLQTRLQRLLEAAGHPSHTIGERVRILSHARRPVEAQVFDPIAQALMNRRRLELRAWNRARDEVNTRSVSPQRLVHYRDNWYLDAYCHWREALRSFAVDAIRQARIQPEAAIEIDSATLDAHYASAYGIFAGPAPNTAILRFTAERARWVRHERWHPEQTQEDLPDGSLRLRIPYGDERELIMDILRHGRHVVVEAPESLRERVAEEARALLAHHAAS